MKEIPHFRGTPVHAFRVPLDTYGKWMTFQFNCLNSSVLRAGADHNPLSGSVDCLMVETVYIETASGIFPEAGSTFCADPMADFFTGSGLLHVVEGVTGNEGHILPDRTPAGYVEDLHSPADGEHRFSRGKNPFHEPDLKEIYGNACFTISVFRFFAEEQRGDISAAAEEKSVAEICVLRKDAVAPDKRKNERESVGIADGLNIWISDKLSVSGEPADNDSDFRLHRILLSLMYDRICKKLETYSYHRKEEELREGERLWDGSICTVIRSAGS